MYNREHLHVVVASDDNYAEFVATLLVSLFSSNAESFERIMVHLLANGIKPSTIRRITEHIPADRGELLTYDISDISGRLGIEVPKTIAISAYARLFIQSLLPQDISRVLYLDCDTIVADSLGELWQTDLKDCFVGGVLDTLPDTVAKTKVGLSEDMPYINSGVLLIDLEQWRKADLQSLFLNFLLSHGGHVHHHDQGLINGVCKGHVKVLHPRYNLTTNYLSHRYDILRQTNTPFYSEEQISEAKSHPAIIHFTAGFLTRPWCRGSRHPFATLFRQMHGRTAWRDTPLREDDRSLGIKLHSWTFLHLPQSWDKYIWRTK